MVSKRGVIGRINGLPVTAIVGLQRRGYRLHIDGVMGVWTLEGHQYQLRSSCGRIQYEEQYSMNLTAAVLRRSNNKLLLHICLTNYRRPTSITKVAQIAILDLYLAVRYIATTVIIWVFNWINRSVNPAHHDGATSWVVFFYLFFWSNHLHLCTYHTT
jgi:hypothetical protein